MRYVAKFDTQTHAAESLHGISSSTISQVKNHNWELLSERLWHHLASQVGFFSGTWQAADTSTYLLMRILMSDAQQYAMAYGVSIATGLGKTFTASRYAAEHDHVCYLACNDQFNRRSFMAAMMHAAGIQGAGTMPAQIQLFSARITSKENPLLILDDAHKLKDRVLHLIVLLANELSGKAGIIIMGSDMLRERIIEGVRDRRPGFDEIFKAIGKRFIVLSNPGPKDIELVCMANGLHDTDTITYINEQCTNLHTATRMILQQMDMRTAA